MTGAVIEGVSIYTMLMGCSLVFTALVCVLFGLRIYKAIHKKYYAKDFNHDKDVVGSYLSSWNMDLVAEIRSPNRYLKSYLRQLAETVDGDFCQNLLDFYIALGFVTQDLARLNSRWYFRRVDALTSLRSFNYQLSETQWDALLREDRWEFRWATMEYLVSVNGKHSLNRLVSFLSARKNIYQGNLHHLLSHYASINTDAIVYLLRFSDDERLVEALLRTLSIYPVPGSEQSIRTSFNFMSSRSVIIAGLAALDAHPESENLMFLKQFALHEDHGIRTSLAKNLRHYTGGVDILEGLAIDGSFEVRTRVAESLAELLPYSGTVVAEILEQSAHPCHEFLKVHGITIPQPQTQRQQRKAA